MQASPGCTLTDLSGHLGVTRATIGYHLQLLHDAKLVQPVQVHGTKRLYPYGRAPRPTPLPSKVQAAVWDVLRASPEGLTRSELKQALPDVPARTRNHSIAQMLKRGIVEEKAGERGRVLVARRQGE